MILTNFNLSVSGGFTETAQMSDLVADYCTKLDNKIMLTVSLILLYFLFHNIILPRAFVGFQELLKDHKGYSWLLDDYIKPLYGKLISLIETLGLGAALFLVGYVWFWGWAWYTWAIVIIGGVSIFLILVAEGIGWLRRRKA